jgi:hypothetical protein
VRKRYEANEREQLSETVRASDATVKAAAKQLGVKESMRRGQEDEPPQLARLIRAPVMPTASMSIDVGGAVIRLDAGVRCRTAARWSQR